MSFARMCSFLFQKFRYFRRNRKIIEFSLHIFVISLEKKRKIRYNSIVYNYLLPAKKPQVRKRKERPQMELKTIQHLCELSKLNYDEPGLNKVMSEMSDIIDLMDTIKSFDLTYDDTKDNNSITFGETRADEAMPSFPTEKLLANAENADGCYVVPKVVE